MNSAAFWPVWDRAAQVDVEVLFLHGADAPDSWRSSASVDVARGIPGLKLRVDETGAETKRYGAYTSGQVLVFDANGGLGFAGGITPGRGHEGDSAGAEAALAVLRGEASGPHGETGPRTSGWQHLTSCCAWWP